MVNDINFVKSIDPKTGELVGRRDFSAGKAAEPLCPAIGGGVSWNSGSYNPKTGLYYKIGNEWCISLDVVKTTPVTEPSAQLNIGANFKLVSAAGRRDLRPSRRARSDYRREEVGGPLSRAADGERAVDRAAIWCSCPTAGASCTPTTRRPAASCGTTAMASAIRAASSAMPPAASSTSPSSRALAAWSATTYAPTFGEPYKSMPRDDGVLVVYCLK